MEEKDKALEEKDKTLALAQKTIQYECDRIKIFEKANFWQENLKLKECLRVKEIELENKSVKNQPIKYMSVHYNLS